MGGLEKLGFKIAKREKQILPLVKKRRKNSLKKKRRQIN
jgi:hypothetical protein